MILSPLEVAGTSQKNGFPIVVGRIEAEVVSGKVYRSFNEQLAMALMPFKDQGMINLVLICENPQLKLPSPGEIRKALQTEAGKFLEEFLRQLVLVGFKDELSPEVAEFSTRTSGTKVSLADDLETAFERLGLLPTSD
ncbi:MAG TPA: hypothetical protein VF209_02625 [Patescibacteria group bacterium]